MSSIKLQLEPAQNGNETIELLTDKDGRFAHRSSQTGIFWWSFPGLQPEYFVNRITVDGKDVTNRPVTIDEGSELREVSIEISGGAAEIRGTSDAATCQNNIVFAAALDSSGDHIQSVQKARCSADAFKIQSLAPGRYYVIGIPAGAARNQFEAIEKAVATLKSRGFKPLTLDRQQIHPIPARYLLISVVNYH